MLATVNDLVALLEELMPSNLAEDWDNVGLMLGRRGKTVKKILLALDLTKEVVEQAISQKADLIVTHHPAIFKKLKRVVDNDWQQDLLLTLAENGIAVYSEYERLLTGAEDFSTFVNKLFEAVDRYVNESIYQAMLSAAEQLPGGATGAGQWVKTGELNDTTKEVFVQLIEDVQMATGMDVVIMGTKTALSKLEGIQDINWISEEMRVARNTTGRIGTWEGIRLVELKQGFKLNDTTARLIDDKQLLIMPVGSNKFIKVINEGNPEMRQVGDNTMHQDMTYDYTYMWKMGVGVQINLLFGVYNIAA